MILPQFQIDFHWKENEISQNHCVTDSLYTIHNKVIELLRK